MSIVFDWFFIFPFLFYKGWAMGIKKDGKMGTSSRFDRHVLSTPFVWTVTFRDRINGNRLHWVYFNESIYLLIYLFPLYLRKGWKEAQKLDFREFRALLSVHKFHKDLNGMSLIDWPATSFEIETDSYKLNEMKRKNLKKLERYSNSTLKGSFKREKVYFCVPVLSIPFIFFSIPFWKDSIN